MEEAAARGIALEEAREFTALPGRGVRATVGGRLVEAGRAIAVGGVPADVLYAGDAGVLQVNIRVPENAPIGGAVPVVLMVGDTQSSNGVTMAVRSSALRILVVDRDAENLAKYVSWNCRGHPTFTPWPFLP